MSLLALGPFRPDIADTNPGILADLLNASIKPDSAGVAYGPLPGLTVADTAVALPAAPKGTLTAVTAGGVYVNFVMTTTDIYKFAADGSYTSIGSGYNLPAGDKWSSAQFGTKAIFTNTVDGMLEYDVDVPGAVTAISGAPKARVVRVVFDTLFALDCDGENKLVQNSDFNYSNWRSGVAGYQPEPNGEELVGIEEVIESAAIILARNAIRTVQRIPDSSLYVQFLTSAKQGAVNPYCIVSAAGAVYFVDTNGFKKAVPGKGDQCVTWIGQDKVNEWLIARMDADAMASIEGAYDPERGVIRWRYRVGTDADDTVFANAIDYDIAANEFVPVEESTAAIFETATSGYTMEELDAFGDMDSIALSLDDRFWFGGAPRMGALDEDFKLGYFSGANLAFMAETTTLSDNMSSKITSLRPVTDAADVTVRVGRSDQLAVALSWNAAAGLQPSGRIAINPETRGKNHRIRANIPAGSMWTYIRGFDDIMPRMGGPK